MTPNASPNQTEGKIHVEEVEADFSDTTIEAWVGLAFFWVLGLTVLYQFTTRYVMNNSAAWTEEIARYLLIALVFVGSVIGVTKNNHIQVNFFYRFMSSGVARFSSLTVDVVKVLFFMAACVLTVQMMLKLKDYKMTIVDLPMNLVYGVVFVAFCAMLVRSVLALRIHWRQGWSLLERPEVF